MGTRLAAVTSTRSQRRTDPVPWVGLLMVAVVVGAVMAAGTALTACTLLTPEGQQQATAVVQQTTSTTAATLAKAKADQEARLAAALAAADPAGTQKANDTLVAIAQVQAKVDAVNATLAKVVKPDGTVNVGAVGSEVGALLPPPWNLIAILGGPLIAAGIQQWRLNQKQKDLASITLDADQAQADAESIVKSIDVLRAHPTAGPSVKAAMAGIKPQLQAVLTPGAKSTIEEVAKT